MNEDYAALAARTTREEFVAKCPHLFLLYHEPKTSTPGGQFFTEALGPDGAPRTGPGSLRVVPLVKSPDNPYSDRVSIGRARNCDIVLRETSVSKLHAHVRRGADGQWSLVDLGSHNGTAVDGKRIEPEKPVPLVAGMVITLGAVTVRVMESGTAHGLLAKLGPGR